jgi:hypothetical protein
VTLHPVPSVPLLPCLDHEAMLHETVAPHVATYLQDRDSEAIHELVFIPERREIRVDTVSTFGECSPEARARLLEIVSLRFPDYTLKVEGPSWWRGERRVAVACRAQVTLREVLLGDDMARVRAGIERLQTIGALMEKESRVASWGVRTLTGPLLAGAGVILFLILGTLEDDLGEAGVTGLRYALISLLGGTFVYYGLKAVQLTEMANRVWKRAAEYKLILSERQRLGGDSRTVTQ